jgi:hypothetical protein
MRFHHGIIAAFLACLAGCNASSAGGNSTAQPGVHGQVLGTRGVPGGTVTVSTDGPLQPGAAAVFHLALSPDMPAPAAVRAWIGVAYDPTAAGIPATPVETAPGSYEVAATVPSPVAAGSHVWIRLSFADGSVVETGSEDFPLAGR